MRQLKLAGGAVVVRLINSLFLGNSVVARHLLDEAGCGVARSQTGSHISCA
ncbi:hypothetical protein CAter282_3408 [Collimonas arenae]|uniref:Uncharacterized protein n=1 Tax=Collimonas arenae TaxID=279058 RepID=A0A127QM58_9BURK|nr:hypothetical protein CAter282_3408 [Collimonas arenae]